MNECFFNEYGLNYCELGLYHCGEERCNSGHSYGPAVRDHYLIHYIISGEGVFQKSNMTYHLKKGQGFLICPDEITFYKADIQNPWHYMWVGFNGFRAKEYLNEAELTQESPIFSYDRDDKISKCISQMLIDADTYKKGRELQLLSHLYSFLSQILEVSRNEKNNKNESMKELYVRSVVNFIQTNYSSANIGVDKMAHYAGISRKYLYIIFKEMLSTSPQQFLLNYRMKRASELIKETELSIGDISRSIGYEDPFVFSKIFKKVFGMCPRDYRKVSVESSDEEKKIKVSVTSKEKSTYN